MSTFNTTVEDQLRAGDAAESQESGPYRGLAAFHEADAALFFGRARFVQQKLLPLVEAQPLVAVVGASGAGKSSVVLAGLLPALRARPGWLLPPVARADYVFRPGPDPFQALALALLALLEPAA